MEKTRSRGHFCRLPFAVNAMLNLPIVKRVLETICLCTPKSENVALVDWRLVFGHSLLLLHSGRRLLLSGSLWAAVVVHRSISYSQDLKWRFMFVWNLGLSVEEAVFYLGDSTWTVESYPRRYQYLHKTQPPLFNSYPQWRFHTNHTACQIRSLEAWLRHTAIHDDHCTHRAAKQSSPRKHRE